MRSLNLAIMPRGPDHALLSSPTNEVAMVHSNLFSLFTTMLLLRAALLVVVSVRRILLVDQPYHCCCEQRYALAVPLQSKQPLMSDDVRKAWCVKKKTSEAMCVNLAVVVLVLYFNNSFLIINKDNSERFLLVLLLACGDNHHTTISKSGGWV